MIDDGPRPLDPPSGIGRTFSRSCKVRLADADGAGRLRLDSLLRYTQDVSDDDTTDAGLGHDAAWVARRSVIDVLRPAAVGETLDVTTFCGGLGRSCAERRLRLTGEGGVHGAHYEVSTLWICLHRERGRPIPLSDRFLELYREAAAGRRAGARLTLPGPEPAGPGDRAGSAGWAPWPLRLVDYDLLGHVNNAAYAAALEELQAGRWVEPPCRWTIEYRAGIDPGAQVTLRWRRDGDRAQVWWLLGPDPVDDPELAASASVGPLPAGLYRS